MKRILLGTIMTFSLLPVILTGCHAVEESNPADTEVVTLDEAQSAQFYKDVFNGLTIKLEDGWEVSQQNDAYTTITPTAANPIQNASIIVSYQTDFPVDNTYEMYLMTIDLKNAIKWHCNGKTFKTLGYYQNTPVEEMIGDKAVMVETPTLSLEDEDNSGSKLKPKAKFFYYGGYLKTRNIMVGYISDEESEAKVEAVVRSMIPKTDENRTQNLDGTSPDKIAFKEETIKMEAGAITMQVPTLWERTNLMKYGTLYRSSYQRGSAYEDSFVFITSKAVTQDNVELFPFVTSNVPVIVNATMKAPVAESGINYTSQVLYNTIEDKNYLGLGGTLADVTMNITSAGTNVYNEDIGGKSEQMLITAITKDDTRYLICLGYSNPSNNETYANNIKLLNEKIVNSINFQ